MGSEMCIRDSYDQKLAEKALEYEENNDTVRLGKILGYPGCCISFFSKNEATRSKLDNDYIVPMLKNSLLTHYPFFMNILNRNNDYALLSHFPCSLDCMPSFMIAKSNFDTLQRVDYDASEDFVKNLVGKFNNIEFTY